MAELRDGRVDVLIMAAHALELTALRAAIGADSGAIVHGRTVQLAEVGVGAMLAGGGAMRALLETRPRAALLVGSCGVYPEHAFEPGQLALPRHVRAVDAAVLEGRAAFPAPMPAELELDAALAGELDTALRGSPTLAGGPALHGALATTLAITTDDALATRIGLETGCMGENLEALSVALACRAQGVPLAVLLGVTNEVGSNGRTQWREHNALAARNTSACVLRWLASAAGTPHP